VFIGHALLGFALAALIADWRGWPARRALTLGLVAGAFAAIPEVDVAYAAVALDLGRLSADSLTRPSMFWGATREVHRTMTHSLVVVASLANGPPGGIVTGMFAVTGLGVATLCRLRTSFRARTVGLAATAGLLSHPWGDLLTGSPPFRIAGRPCPYVRCCKRA
jgi:membrane-bound metal-dependent hydrolase YbcI (DUF457 family)